MATLFVDLEAGNDNYAGTSFALLASGTDGRISSTTFSSATASFPNDGSLINQYLSIFNGSIYAVYQITAWVSATSLTIAAISGGTSLANQTVDRQFYIGGRWKSLTSGATAVRLVAGDTVRIMGSPAPTSLGINGTWTSGALQAAKQILSSTNATPISITCTAHGYTTGDTVVITGHATNTNANGTWEITSTGANTFTLDGSVGNGTGGGTGSVRLRNNTVVRLASALTANIASTGPRTSAWTVSANVTATLSTGTKEHYQSDSIAIAAGFTTGLAAYWPTGTLDLSGYQQVSFWIHQTAGSVGAAGAVDLRLCSDAAGTTAVNTINIPNLTTTNRWMPVTVDLGTALGSNIQSIALYVNTDNGAQTFLLSNIIACKASSAADSLTLTSLIGKNVEGETFWGIQSINGTRVMLDGETNVAPTTTTLRGYYGTSETVTTWKRETIKTGPSPGGVTFAQTVNESGTNADTFMTFSGGWDRTNMSSQDLETWLDNVNGAGIIIGDSFSARSYLRFEKLAFVRGSYGMYFTASSDFYDISLVAANNNSTGSTTSMLAFEGDGVSCNVIVGHMVANSGTAMRVPVANSVFKVKYGLLSNGSNGVALSADPGQLLLTNDGATRAVVANNGSSGFSFATAGRIQASNFRFADNLVASASVASTAVYFSNCVFDDATEISIGTSNSAAAYSQTHDGVSGSSRIVLSGAVISSATDQRKTPSGISWKIQPTSTNRSAIWPVIFSLAKVACSANNLVTVKAWMRRTNTALTMRLVCKGGQLAGVASDVVASMTAAADTWEELTITFTPTEIGVVEITAEAYGGSTHSGWVDDMTITQA